MADCVEGAGFWLPSEFFDDFLMDKENLQTTESESEFSFPTEFPYDFGTKRDEHLEKPRAMSTSPQSTLTRIDSWPGRSPNAAPSPPPLVGNDAVGDLIYLAAGQVAKLKLNDGPTKHNGLLGPPKIPTPSVIHHVYLQRQKQGCGMWYGEAPMVARDAWHVQQNSARIVGPSARAVVYGGGAAVAKRECAGTGVFLPRRYGNTVCKRPGASIPNRNVHSNQNSENINCFLQPQPHLQPKFIPEYDLLMARRNAMMLQHRRSLLLEGSSLMARTVPRSRLFID